ncbi:MAG: hypothetical protein EOO17_04275 [Chloroflexi bacterium]|nr:MAG: hypothetical protein EOO17_04275 [Chloroflexota bacterium]
MDIVVVFGSVTSATYQHLRVAMMDVGLNPKIVRIGADRYYLDDEVHTLLKKRHGVDDAESIMAVDDDAFEAVVDDVRDDFVKKTFLTSDEMKDVKAFILPYSEDGLAPRWEWMTDRFPKDVAEYSVQKAENDGSFWLSGSGFGDSLPDIEILD